MPATRHVGAGLTLLVALGAFAGLQVLTPGVLAGQSKDRYPAAGGDLEITTFIHNSLQLEHHGLVVHIDPWSVADLSLAKPADLILITDDPAHHLDPEAIKRLRKPGAPVVTPPNGRAKVPDGVVLKNGESSVQAGIKIEAIAAYDLTPGEPYHPKGESNGYVITLGGKRVFVVGITECVPEVRAVRDVDVAFMPLSLPVGRMAAPAAVECTKALKPKVVYPYHYDQDYATNIARGRAVSSPRPGVEEFVRGLAGEPVQVKLADWYPTRDARTPAPPATR